MLKKVWTTKKKPAFCHRLLGRALKDPVTSVILWNLSPNVTERKKTGFELEGNRPLSLVTGQGWRWVLLEIQWGVVMGWWSENFGAGIHEKPRNGICSMEITSWETLKGHHQQCGQISRARFFSIQNQCYSILRHNKTKGSDHSLVPTVYAMIDALQSKMSWTKITFLPAAYNTGGGILLKLESKLCRKIEGPRHELGLLRVSTWTHGQHVCFWWMHVNIHDSRTLLVIKTWKTFSLQFLTIINAVLPWRVLGARLWRCHG